ncbi:hypothetical protein ZOSMA_75G00530 [Zostera marina]|uniref:Uncharacterized protein n=1 Tax=Zostera marina TaxID=29655 RepID=A0A0K9NRM9_ZOSMR|nr:hypothetical protein ZOSMA_75G00530 [Zostera marina]
MFVYLCFRLHAKKHGAANTEQEGSQQQEQNKLESLLSFFFFSFLQARAHTHTHDDLSVSDKFPMEGRFTPNLSNGFALALLLVLSCWKSGGTTTTTTTTIHDLLRQNGLPGGLLPKSVRSFELNNDTGILKVDLDGPCYAKYDNLAYFDKVVTANLSYGELNGVVGLSQEELFLWLPVKGILVSDPSSGVILFDIGVAHKQLSLSLFQDPPDCRPIKTDDDQLNIRSGRWERKSKNKSVENY